MSRIGTVVKRLYGDQVKPANNNSGADMDVKPSRRKKKFTALKKTLGSRRTLIWAIRIVVVLVVLFILCLLALFVDKPSIEKSFIDRSLIGKQSRAPKIIQLPSVPKKRIPTKAIPLSAPKEKSSAAKKLPALYLTGIFFSDGEYLALMNDRIVKVGDFIEEVRIQKIDSDGVDVKFKDSSFRLNYP